MGEVHRARDTKLNRDVALKVLPDLLLQDSERRARFQREAQILAALNHPNVAAIYGWEDTGEAPALVMELVEGRPLSGLIPRRGMPFAEALKLAIQLARGLESAHLSGIVHRDLKPANVMVTSAGMVKILDFGLAKLVEPAGAAPGGEDTLTAGRTLEGMVVGTPAYMSPEQAQGKPVDARSDIFSFGIVLYQMLTGNHPFRAENYLSTLAAILHEEPKPAGEVAALPIPREAEQLLARALRKDPERRFQTGSDLRAALEDLAEQASSGQLDASQSVPRRRLPWGWAVGALALLATAGWAWTDSAATVCPPRQLYANSPSKPAWRLCLRFRRTAKCWHTSQTAPDRDMRIFGCGKWRAAIRTA
jgi:serine/threonine protein kinase